MRQCWPMLGCDCTAVLASVGFVLAASVALAQPPEGDAARMEVEAQWQRCSAYARHPVREPGKAKESCLPPAQAGHIWAQETLGQLYARSSPRDYPEAIRWYRLASDQGSAVARISMYDIYMEGRRGVPRDLVKALAYLDYAQFGRMRDGHKIVFTGVGRRPRTLADGTGGWARGMLAAKMAPEQIDEAAQLLHEWTAGEAPPQEPVIEYRYPD